MSLHESRRSPARRIDDLQLLQGLLTQRLYVPEHDRRLLRALLAETPRQLRTTPRATRRGARRLRATGAALALSGALALTLGSPLLTVVAASPQPATWVAVADHAADNLAAPADDVLLRALLNRASTPIQTVATAPIQAVASTDQISDVLLRALLNSESSPIQTVATAPIQAVAIADQAASPASDVLLRALLNSESSPVQAVATADDALAQAELTVGETLVIPAAQATDAIVADAIVAAPSYSVDQQTVSYYVVQPGDTLSGIALAFYGNGNLWPTIFNANTDKIADPHWIYPNQQLTIPAVYSAFTAPSAPARPQAAQGAISQYTVQSGDTLSGIAAYAYGNANWWGIYQANAGQIHDPNLIYPGQVLAIP
jgi:nucleoid-associated protein YgaU